MINTFLSNALHLVALTLVQVLVISNIGLGYFVNPYIYTMFIMLIPFSVQQWLLILIAFFTGIIIDAFSNSMGMHAAACTFMAFARPAVLTFLTPKSSLEYGDRPGLQPFGYIWFLAYTGMLTLLHHLVYFYLEVFSFENFFLTLGKVLLSTVVSTTLIMLTAMIFSPGSKSI